MNDPWKHRSENMRCKTCMWFVPKVPSGEEPKDLLAQSQLVGHNAAPKAPAFHLGRCRRHAPTMSGFPAVFVNDWCGDHRIDENKLP